MGEQMTGAEILALRMDENDAGVVTVRDYLIALLLGVWRDREGFNGKRPFGNSGWWTELAKPLVKAGAVIGARIDGRGEILMNDRLTHWREVSDEIDGLITSAIQALREPS